MSSYTVMLYETLYRLASEDVGRDLFGTNAPLAQEAFQRASAGASMPIVWFEIPLSGPPRFDLHVAHDNADIHEYAPFASDAMDGHGDLLNWYASEPRAGGGLALAYDVGDGRIGAPAVHANVNAVEAFDAEGFFIHVGRPEAAVLYRGFEKQLPRGWHIWYLGVHPDRLGAPVRVDCLVGASLKRAYAAQPAKFEEDLRQVGFAVEGSAARRVGAEVAASPFSMELQFDILSDGALGQTVGISAQFPLAKASIARMLWEPTGGAAQLMEFAENSRVADARWRRIRDAMFSMAVQDGGVLHALYCSPVFTKFRVRADELFDAKIYLQAGVVNSLRSHMVR
ncbi:MAG: hypothetical protein IKE22_10530 [Atopobiaceae bacterium]|nr:hypothetical protein [Atopobiaceae bacterium]